MGYTPPQGGGLSWEQIKFKLEEEGSLNKKYDADKDGVVDITRDIKFSFEVTDDVIKEDTTEESTSNTSYTLIKEITMRIGSKIPTPLTLRIVYTLRIESEGAGWGYAQIYRNGVAVGTERVTTSGSYTTYTEDIEGWNDGDKVQLYLKQKNITKAFTNLLSVRGRVNPNLEEGKVEGEITA